MKRSVRLLLLFLTLAVAGCGLVTQAGRDLANADALFEKGKYAEALDLYRKTLSLPHSAGRDAEARFAIASTLAFYDNPQKNYVQALEAFEEFLKRHPNHEKAAEALNWKHALKTLVEETRECEHLKKNIEQLKRLDIRHEEKRKGR